MKSAQFYKYLWRVVVCTLLFPACSENEDNPSPQETPLKNKTVLAYFVGDISLWFCIEESVNKLEAGWQDDLDGNLLIYLDHSPHLTQFSSPVLLKVRHDETDRIVSEVVKTYPDQDAGDPEVMHNVLSDVLEMYPAKSYGLIIGTHGSGAAPGSITVDPHEDNPDTRALVGSERYDSQLEIYQLADLLPTHYEFILFHACLMGNVETAYALKNKCDFMVASSEPLPGPALPYDIVTPFFFTKPQADFYHVLNKSVDWYNALPDDEYQTLTLSVTRTDKLDALAAATKPLIKRYSADPTTFYTNMENAYEYGTNDGASSMFYDMAQVVDLQMDEEHPTAEEYAFRNALDAAVPLVCASKSWETHKLDIEDICGLSCYIPFASEAYKPFNTFFKTHYGWIEAAGIDLLM